MVKKVLNRFLLICINNINFALDGGLYSQVLLAWMVVFIINYHQHYNREQFSISFQFPATKEETIFVIKFHGANTRAGRGASDDSAIITV